MRRLSERYGHYELACDEVATLKANYFQWLTETGQEEKAAELKKCKFLSLRGARVHVPLEAEPTHFELHLAEAEVGLEVDHEDEDANDDHIDAIAGMLLCGEVQA